MFQYHVSEQVFKSSVVNVFAARVRSTRAQVLLTTVSVPLSDSWKALFNDTKRFIQQLRHSTNALDVFTSRVFPKRGSECVVVVESLDWVSLTDVITEAHGSGDCKQTADDCIANVIQNVLQQWDLYLLTSTLASILHRFEQFCARKRAEFAVECDSCKHLLCGFQRVMPQNVLFRVPHTTYSRLNARTEALALKTPIWMLSAISEAAAARRKEQSAAETHFEGDSQQPSAGHYVAHVFEDTDAYLQQLNFGNLHPFYAWPLSTHRNTDLWSFGCCLFEVLYGVPLFSAESGRSQLQLVSCVLGIDLAQLYAVGDAEMDDTAIGGDILDSLISAQPVVVEVLRSCLIAGMPPVTAAATDRIEDTSNFAMLISLISAKPVADCMSALTIQDAVASVNTPKSEEHSAETDECVIICDSKESRERLAHWLGAEVLEGSSANVIEITSVPIAETHRSRADDECSVDSGTVERFGKDKENEPIREVPKAKRRDLFSPISRASIRTRTRHLAGKTSPRKKLSKTDLFEKKKMGMISTPFRECIEKLPEIGDGFGRRSPEPKDSSAADVSSRNLLIVEFSQLSQLEVYSSSPLCFCIEVEGVWHYSPCFELPIAAGNKVLIHTLLLSSDLNLQRKQRNGKWPIVICTESDKRNAIGQTEIDLSLLHVWSKIEGFYQLQSDARSIGQVFVSVSTSRPLPPRKQLSSVGHSPVASKCSKTASRAFVESPTVKNDAFNRFLVTRCLH